MSQQKSFKKGEFLIKEGQKVDHLFLITSGLVSVCVVRDKKNIELFRAGSGQVIGEEALAPGNNNSYVAMALNETKVFDVPVQMMGQQIDTLNPMMKLFVKGLLEKQKAATGELQQTSQAMAQHMHAKAGGAAPGAPEGTAGKTDGPDDVIDAEYEVKK